MQLIYIGGSTIYYVSGHGVNLLTLKCQWTYGPTLLPWLVMRRVCGNGQALTISTHPSHVLQLFKSI